MHRSLRTLATLLATLLALAGLGLDAGPVGATPPRAPASNGLRLTVPGGPHAVGVPITITLSTTRPAAAFEGVVTFDPAALSFGGADGPAPARVLAMEENGRIALAALPCRDNHCAPVAPKVTITMTPLVGGRLQIGLDATMVIDRNGEVVATGGMQRNEVTVDNSTQSEPAPEAEWNTDRHPAPIEGSSADVTDDGVATSIDLTEGVIAWLEGHVTGDPCALDPTSADGDVNGDGCADIADLENIRRSLDSEPPPSTTTTPSSPSARSTDPTPASGGHATNSGGSTELAPASAREPSTFSTDASAPTTAQASAVSSPTPRPPFVVDTTGDERDANTHDGTCATSTGSCTLRAAIQQANATSGPDRIAFAIPGTGLHTIQLTSRLPTINDPTGALVVDGYTQPGSSPNTDPLVSNAADPGRDPGTGDECRDRGPHHLHAWQHHPGPGHLRHLLRHPDHR